MQPSTSPDGAALIGADLLDIITVAMYSEPLVVYRELVQNAADAIQQARNEGLLAANAGSVEITLDGPRGRDVVLRDNGVGVPNALFAERMLSIGASAKRGGELRGFRGIGRLAALGYCRNLVFRSRAAGDRYVCEARWDGMRARRLYVGAERVSLAQALPLIVTLDRRAATKDDPAHFFEVRLEGVIRLSNDALTSPQAVANYLAQVAPVAFAPTFTHGEQIRQALLPYGGPFEFGVLVKGSPVHRPYVDSCEVRRGRFSTINEIEVLELRSCFDDGASIGAVAWIAHHEYLGALPATYGGRGIRARVGNLQVGESTIFARSFPEERFNAWAVGEVHVLDTRYRPNARRDAFEHRGQRDLEGSLMPALRGVATRIRRESHERNDDRRVRVLSKTLDEIAVHVGAAHGAATQAGAIVLEHLAAEATALPAHAATDEVRTRIDELRAKVPVGDAGANGRADLQLVARLQQAGRTDLVVALLPYL